MFIYIVQYPDNPNVNSDVALMDICAGHFALLEFATDSEISIPLVKEVANLARDIVSRGRPDTLEHANKTPSNALEDLNIPFPTAGASDATIYDNLPEEGNHGNTDRNVSCSCLLLDRHFRFPAFLEAWLIDYSTVTDDICIT